jgi:hypothetical protein
MFTLGLFGAHFDAQQYVKVESFFTTEKKP